MEKWKKLLRELKNTTFVGKNPEEVVALKEQMARLTEGIRDFQEQNCACYQKVEYLHLWLDYKGIVAGAQLVTGTLAMFGIENEN